jgi:hypothetical protein
MPTNRKPKLAEPTPRKNTKVTGERSEAAFLHKAATLEFGIAKPWGDSRRYDFILDNGDRLHRIQVKCTEAIRAQAYETRATYSQGSGRAVYTKKDIDFIAAHVVPLDIWYIIPVEICTPAPMLRFYPHRQAKKMRLESYREAWHLLQAREQEEAETIELNASADETIENSCHSERSGMIRESGSSPESRNLLFSAPTKPVRLAKTLAPWPIPPLKILATRKGKRIFPDAPS